MTDNYLLGRTARFGPTKFQLERGKPGLRVVGVWGLCVEKHPDQRPSRNSFFLYLSLVPLLTPLPGTQPPRGKISRPFFSNPSSRTVT